MIKQLIGIAFIGIGAASCSSLKPVSSGKPSQGKVASSPRFIENVHIMPSGAAAAPAGSAYGRSGKTSHDASFAGTSITESLSSLQFKYGIMLNIAVEQLTNIRLLETIDEWYGARYRYGGTTKSGIDCSAFAGTLMTAVFGLSLPRTAREQYSASQRIEKEELKEGDLVFFNTTGGISHVGVYLDNNKFVHASTSAGVMISDLNDEYYARKYVGAGRIL